jgi:hypothetical protein
MIAVMGPPPLDFLRQCGDKADQYWDKNGQCGKIDIPILRRELYPSNAVKQALGKI